MGIRAKKGDAKRRCLKCGREFNSVGPHNRLCWQCNLENSGLRCESVHRVLIPAGKEPPR